MQSLAIICESHIDPEQIAERLKQQYGFKIKIYNNALALVGAVNDGLVDGLIFGISRFTTPKAQMLDVIKGKLPTFPIVLASEKLDSTARLLATAYKNFTIIKYPEEINTLDGIFVKMFRDEVVSAREHVRYDTNIPAKLIVLGQEATCIVKNLSHGGAQIEVKDIIIHPNQEFTLKVPLFNELKKHKVIAKAIWVQKLKNQSIIGLEFPINESRLYE